MGDAYKCSQCGCSLTEEYWCCYYALDDDDNRVCGEGDCWAGWIQDNMEYTNMEVE